MTDDLPPALSAEEWRIHLEEGVEIDRREAAETGTNLVAAIAIYNADLPDDSPYKITRDDVKALRDQIDWLQMHHFNGPTLIDGIAAKLAALLPPE